MSQNSKKVGLKKLSTKHNSKLTNEKKKSSDQLFQDFDSFISLSNSNQDGNKDESLSVDVVGSITKSLSSPESQTDFFRFPKKKSSIVPTEQICLETTSLSPVSTYSSELVELDTRLSELIGNGKTSNETCTKYVRVSNLFNDSSLLFQNKASSFNQNQRSNNEVDPIFVKALSDNIVSNNGSQNGHVPPLSDDDNVPKIIGNDCVSKRDHNVEESSKQTHPETIQQCPVCLKTVSKYVNHMKSCAAKNNLNTQQLLSALKLHKKQLAERKELGLDVPAPQSYRAKVSPKRSRANNKKGPQDANLQLALALSASLRSAEEDEVIQEAEALKEAGLTMESDQRLGTLEQFGFASAFPPQPRSAQGSSKSRPLPRSLLLERSKEERERIVTEKIAIVLISEEENVTLDTFDLKEPNVKSKLLEKAWDKECRLWVKAHCEEKKRSKFYVDSLSEFVSPCKVEVGAGLRRLSQLPGRLNTPERENFFDHPSSPSNMSPTSEETNFCNLLTPPRELPTNNHSFLTAPTPKRSSLIEIKHKLSEDWKSLVNNPELSDLEIRCDNGIVPAHRLVLHVRCPKALLCVKEDNNRRVIVLKNCSKTAALAMLEFVYAGSLTGVLRLDEEDFNSLSCIADEFDLHELKNHLKKLDKSRERFNRNKSQNDTSELDINGSQPQNISMQAQKRKSVQSEFRTLPENELRPSNEFELLDSRRGSLDMFGDSDVTENERFSNQTQNDLDILASLVGKTTQVTEDRIDELDNNDCSKASGGSVIVFPSAALANNLSSGKRKALASSDSEELSISKRPCSEWSKRDSSERPDEEVVFDLTQSSNSSDCIPLYDYQGLDKEVLSLRDSNNTGIMEDSMEGLAKKYSSAHNSPKNTSSSSKETPELENRSVFQEVPGKEQQRLRQSSVLDDCIPQDSYQEINSEVLSLSGSKHSNSEIMEDSMEGLTQKDPSVLNSPKNTSPTCKKTPESENRSVFHRAFDKERNRLTQNSVSDGYQDTNSEVLSLSGSKHSNSEIMEDTMEGLTQNDSFQHNSPKNISPRFKETTELENKSINQDYFETAWDGYDDYLHFNYTPITTPVKPSSDTSSGKKRNSQKASTQKISPFSCLKNNEQGSSSVTPKTSTVVNYDLSDSNLCKQSSQKVLDKNSCKSNFFNSESSPSETSIHSNNFQELANFTITKPRKNLSSEFDNPVNSPVHVSEIFTPDEELSQTSNLSEKSLEAFPYKGDDNVKESPLRRDSLVAMQRLLDDSFDINDSVLAKADAILGKEAISSKEQDSSRPSTSNQSKNTGNIINERNQHSMMTPTAEIIASDNVTPLPDYSAMKTPSLKRELSKYGLKPSLGKRKAKLMLRYIYDQTHPFVPDPEASTAREAEVFKEPSEQPKRSPKKKSPRKTQVEANVLDSDDDEDSCSQKSISSVSSSATVPEESFCEVDDVLTQDVCSVVRNVPDKQLEGYKREEKTEEFKEKNVKKEAGQSGSVIGKKTSVPIASGASPSKLQTNIVRKRGRPRKNKHENESSN